MSKKRRHKKAKSTNPAVVAPSLFDESTTGVEASPESADGSAESAVDSATTDVDLTSVTEIVVGETQPAEESIDLVEATEIVIGADGSVETASDATDETHSSNEAGDEADAESVTIDLVEVTEIVIGEGEEEVSVDLVELTELVIQNPEAAAEEGAEASGSDVASESESAESATTESGDAETAEAAPKRRIALGGTIAVAAVSALLLSAWMIGPQAGTSAAIENRPVAQLPKVNVDSLRSVETYKQLESWAVDHVRIKPLAVSTVNSAIASATKQSGSALVIQGSRFSESRDLELFSAEEFTARCRYPASLEKSRVALRALRDAAAVGKKQLLITVVPSKAKTIGYLLGTRLNDLMGCAYNEDLVIAELAKEFPDILKVVDPKRVLKYAPRDPYWSGDTHWTPMGGRALSEIVLAKVANVDIETARQILFNRTVPANKLVRGDLYRLLGFSKTTATTRIATRPAYQLQITQSPFGTGPRVWGWTSPQPLEGATASMLILHDSMVNVPRLTGQFGNVVPEGYDVHWSMAEGLPNLPQVETVVLEFVDRTFLSKLLSFPGIDPAVEDDVRMAAAIRYLAAS